MGPASAERMSASTVPEVPITVSASNRNTAPWVVSTRAPAGTTVPAAPDSVAVTVDRSPVMRGIPSRLPQSSSCEPAAVWCDIPFATLASPSSISVSSSPNSPAS